MGQEGDLELGAVLPIPPEAQRSAERPWEAVLLFLDCNWLASANIRDRLCPPLATSFVKRIRRHTIRIRRQEN